MVLPRYIVTQKEVGETPLIALERARDAHHIPKEVPLAYAGRLDPMASGTLLILVGEECKEQTKYHTFDKEYQVELLLGISSDTGDVLGLTKAAAESVQITEAACRNELKKLRGPIALPYPHFSSKTVRGKPLHMWTLEKRLHEIEIPIKHSRVHRLTFQSLRTLSREEMLRTVRAKIETIPPVIDPRKALGEDFRRDAVRHGWQQIAETGPATYQVLTYMCIASSGTYMRSLSEHLAKSLGTQGLAYSITRTKIGSYRPILGPVGVWMKRF